MTKPSFMWYDLRKKKEQNKFLVHLAALLGFIAIAHYLVLPWLISSIKV